MKSALALGNYASSEDESENEEEAQPPTVLHVPEPVASSSSVEDLGTGLPTGKFSYAWYKDLKWIQWLLHLNSSHKHARMQDVQ